MDNNGETQTLEDISLWYKYKTTVWSEDSPQATTVHNIMRVLRSMCNIQNLAYISTPITSGKYLYEKLSGGLDEVSCSKEKKNGVESQIRKEAMDHYYNEGYAFLMKLEKRLAHPIIFPADLTPARQEWEQSHFQALWLSIISEKATEVHMNKDWEYSNGCSEEFTHVMQLRLGLPKHDHIFFYNTKEHPHIARERMQNIRVYDHTGSLVSLTDGLHSIEKSSAWIKKHGFKTDKIDRCQSLLMETNKMLEKGFYQKGLF